MCAKSLGGIGGGNLTETWIIHRVDVLRVVTSWCHS